MNETINLPVFSDKQWHISIDPGEWRTHDLWCALCNYAELLYSERYAHVAHIMIENILAIMKADFLSNREEAKLQREILRYRRRIIAKHIPGAIVPESFVL